MTGRSCPAGAFIVDVIQISGHAGDVIVNAVMDAKAAKGLTTEPYDLVSVQATKTVRLTFDKLFVPDERVVAAVPVENFVATQHFGSRLNGCLALGLAVRSTKLLEAYGKADQAAKIREQISAVRADLDAGLADPTAMPAARAAGSALAYRAAGAVVVAEGAGGVLVGGHGQPRADERGVAR